MRPASLLYGIALASLAVVQALAAAERLEPSPELSPAEVVGIQLEALQHNDEPTPDAGIALVFRFSSPGNRSQTGPLPRFSEMIHNAYPEMIGHRDARLPPGLEQGDEAIQPVDLLARDGTSYRYLFILSRQRDTDCMGCWMTDSVMAAPRSPADSERTI